MKISRGNEDSQYFTEYPGENNKETKAAIDAARAICCRAPGDDSAQTLLAVMTEAKAPGKIALLRVLSASGGEKALVATCAAIKNTKDDDVRDAAVRALAAWPDWEATEPLLMVSSYPEAKRLHQVLTLRGLMRLINDSPDQPADQRADLCIKALEGKRGAEEKKLVLGALANIPDRKTAQAITPLLDDKEVQAEAGQAGLKFLDNVIATYGNELSADDIADAGRPEGFGSKGELKIVDFKGGELSSGCPAGK